MGGETPISLQSILWLLPLKSKFNGMSMCKIIIWKVAQKTYFWIRWESTVIQCIVDKVLHTHCQKSCSLLHNQVNKVKESTFYQTIPEAKRWDIGINPMYLGGGWVCLHQTYLKLNCINLYLEFKLQVTPFLHKSLHSMGSISMTKSFSHLSLAPSDLGVDREHNMAS